MKKALTAILTLSMIATGCGTSTKDSSTESTTTTEKPKTEIIVSAAISLQKPLETLKGEFEKEHQDIKVTLNLGASGTLQKQIEQGAPADLFWSAGQSQMDSLQKGDMILPETRKDAVNNDVVVVTPKSDNGTYKIKELKDLTNPEIKQVGIGTPETVPAGQYAQESLTTLGIWDAVKPKAVFGKDVKSVLTYVETANVQAGIVYRSDAKTSDKVVIAAEIPANLHKPIVYPIAVVKKSEHVDQAKVLEDFLLTAHAQDVLAESGFTKTSK